MDKEKIINHFGLDFYNKVLRGLETYSKLWGLFDFRQIDYYSVNCIFKCESAKYGPCVLKIGKSQEETKNEYRILREYNGGDYCKVYEADEDNAALLIERIVPGTKLRDEADLDKRLELFCEVFSGLHIEPSGKSVYPEYMDWVVQITEYMRKRSDYKLLYEKMAEAEDICRGLSLKYPGKMLLHGDLHHDNILLCSGGRYRTIDPKGVIGDAVFDIPRFIINEFNGSMDAGKLTYITRTLSGKLGVPEYDIRRLTYVEMCMANCWNVECGDEPDAAKVLFVEKMMDEMPQPKR